METTPNAALSDGPLSLGYFFPCPDWRPAGGERIPAPKGYSYPEYDDIHNHTHTHPHSPMKRNAHGIFEGEVFDIRSLLRSRGLGKLVRKNGEMVDVETAIRGKYLLVCCFLVPLPAHSCSARVCRGMIAACSELNNSEREFEMIMVARMHPRWDSQAHFDNFYSAFPVSCLAIPFSYRDSRDSVSNSLDLTGHGINTWSALVLDPTHKVLSFGTTDFFSFYGGDAFPFTLERLDVLDAQDHILKMRLDTIYKEKDNILDIDPHEVNPGTVSLAELLLCQPSEMLYRKNGESMSVSNLNNTKLVGLYLCYDGSYMDELTKVYQDCLDKSRFPSLDFEIVLVPIPFCDNPQSFDKYIDNALEKKGILSWFRFPFKGRVCRRLQRIGYLQDRLIILRPEGQSGELRGEKLISQWGSDAYPFTRESILEKRLDFVKPFTLEQLLVNVIPGNSQEAVSELRRSKKVLVYNGGDETYNLLVIAWPRIKTVHPDCKLVFIPQDPSSKIPEDSNLPFLKLEVPFDYLTSRLFGNGEDERSFLLVFGKDGRLLSRCADQYFTEVEDLFADNLRQEMVYDLAELDTAHY